MHKDRWLVSWIGATDLRAAKEEGGGPSGIGPIASALKSMAPFERVLLLSNYLPIDESSQFVDWVKRETRAASVDLISVPLNSPIDYTEIYDKIRARLTAERLPRDRVELTFHLSPGTPAMIVVWILLSRTLFPAKLIQTSKEQGVQPVDFPARLAKAFLPEYLQGKEERAQHLTDAEHRFNTIVYESAVMQEVLSQAHKLAKFGVSVLIQGETGTGKDLLANEIHRLSRNAQGPFVAINCGALTSEMANSELFGHMKGAFTGAGADHKGCFERAHGGTLFLDEIAELSLDIQKRLLRVLADGKVTRLGGTDEIPVKVRVIAASHRNLAHEVAANRFREDLYYRLAVGQIELPPLRERGGDIELLLHHFIKQFNADDNLNPAAEQRELTDEAIGLLAAHRWPGNVRELYHTIVRLSIRAEGTLIGGDDVRHCLLGGAIAESNLLERPLGQGFNLQGLLDEVSRHYLRRAFDAARGNKTEASELLGMGNTHHTFSNRWKTLFDK